MNDFSREVWFNTYRYNKAGENDIYDTFRRVANAVGETDNQRLEFYKILSEYTFCPGGRILANAGTHFNTTLYNCYTSPTIKYDPDSIEGIIENLKIQCLTLKSEGGWGENFSYLRPRGSIVKGIGCETPGSVRYMELFNRSADVITSGSGKENAGGKDKKNRIRKGAQMALLSCYHPDVEEFITAKRTFNRLDKFNVSVACNNSFMDKVVKSDETGIDEEIDLYFPDTSYEKYKTEWDGNLEKWLNKNYPINVYKKVSVKYLWDLIMKSTYNYNDPGVIFIDRANETYLGNCAGEFIQKCNPCAEQTMPDASVCDLGSLCLPFLLNKDNTDFDYKKIQLVVKYSVQFLDRINDISNTPHEEYSNNAKEKRRIGLGIMGWGSALYLLKIRFGSEEAECVKTKLMQVIVDTAIETSAELAKEKGWFEGCDPIQILENKFIKSLKLPENIRQKVLQYGLRNSALFSIQPTGNTSILYEVVSGGCEPVFLHEYIRTSIVQSPPEHIKDLCPKYWQGDFHETEMFKFTKEGEETILRGVDEDGVVYKIDRNRGLTKEVLCEDYGVKVLKEHGEWNPNADWAVTTNNLTVRDHITDLQGWAKYIDSSISKTINLPNSYPYEDFKRIYLEAYKSGVIKGVTTYREGTMSTVLSSTDKKDQLPYKRPKKLKCDIHHLTVRGKKYYAVVGLTEDGNVYEIFSGENGYIDHQLKHGFVQRVKDGKYTLISNNEIIVDNLCELCGNEEEAIARLASIAIRNNVDLKDIVNQLEKTKGELQGYTKAMTRVLRRYIPSGTKSEESCAECNKKLIFSEGCKKCIHCNWSKC